MAKEYKEALLEKHYHEGCPGCKVEKMKEVRRGYPYLELSFIWIVILSTCKFVFLFFDAILLLMIWIKNNLSWAISNDSLSKPLI